MLFHINFILSEIMGCGSSSQASEPHSTKPTKYPKQPTGKPQQQPQKPVGTVPPQKQVQTSLM